MEGGFLRQNDMQSTFSKTIDQASGQILVDVSGTAAEGISGTAQSSSPWYSRRLRPIRNRRSSSAAWRPVGPGGEALAVTLPEPHVITVAP